MRCADGNGKCVYSGFFNKFFYFVWFCKLGTVTVFCTGNVFACDMAQFRFYCGVVIFSHFHYMTGIFYVFFKGKSRTIIHNRSKSIFQRPFNNSKISGMVKMQGYRNIIGRGNSLYKTCYIIHAAIGQIIFKSHQNHR